MPSVPLTAVAPAAIENPGGSAEERLISLDNVGKCYRIYSKPHHRLLEAVFHRAYYREFWALSGVNMHVAKGETIGILGQNGSGKSTLLQLAAGTLSPSTGTLAVKGRVAALLELGSGFNPEFTGRENVYLNGAILGISREQMTERFDAIAAFAEIGDFIDQPVKTYSSGMGVRLAFSVAINVDPEILIVDEALSVGDARFQQRCMTRIRQMQNSGVSILFVTHDVDACKRLCQRVYVLDKGRVVNSGAADTMANFYLAFLTSLDSSLVRMSSDERAPAKPASDDAPKKLSYENAHEFVRFRHGDGNASIENCEILDLDGKPVEFAYMDDRYMVRFELSFKIAIPEPILGFYLKDRLGTDLFGINTFQEKTPLPGAEPGDRLTVDIAFPMTMKPGWYSISPALAYTQHEMKYLDYIDHALVFRILDRDAGRAVFGLFHPPVTVTIHERKPAIK